MPQLKTMEFKVDSGPTAARTCIETATEFLARNGIEPNSCPSLELVLAEVLNNVREHAYAEQDSQDIALELELTGDHLLVTCIDFGAEMPNGKLPDGKAPTLNMPRQDLPEGGFGWFLIRNLTTSLKYTRLENCNHLAFSLPIGD